MNTFFCETTKHPPPLSTDSPVSLLLLTPSLRLLGARRSLLELVENLDPARWHPTVVCPGRGGLQERLADAGVSHVVIPHYAWRKGRYAISRYVQAARIAGAARDAGAALIHANEFHSLPQALAAARFQGWRSRRPPVPVTAHVRLGITPRQIRTYGLARAERIVVVSRAVAGLFDEFPAIRERVRVVYNGVNLDRFHPPDEAERLASRRAIGVDSGDFVVGLVGLISPRKCQHVALEAVARLKEAVPGLRLVFAGEPFQSSADYGEQLKRMVESRGLNETVRFLGFRENVREVYAALDINLLISDEEGFGRTIIEAGAMGVASIGTRIGGIPELIEEGVTGNLIDVNDSKALARLILEMAGGGSGTTEGGKAGNGTTGNEGGRNEMSGNRNRIRTMGEAARRHVVEHFSIQAHVEAMERVWMEAGGWGGR